MKFPQSVLIAIAAMSVSLAASAEGALSVSRDAAVNAAPATVWKMIGDYNHLDVWHPAVVGSTVDGDANVVGTVRVLTLGNGATITEELQGVDDGSYTYAILDGPLPVSEYVSTISVTAGEGNGSRVTWSSTFNASGATDQEAVDVIGGIYDAGLASLVKHFSE